MVLAGACTTATAGPDSESAAGPGDAGAGRPSARLAPQEPDVLPDPGVGPGTCALVTYTPPTASAAQQGELCRPRSGQRDALVVLVHGGSGVGGTFAGLRPWQTRLNAEGYVTLNIDYHLFVPGPTSPVFPHPEQNVKAAVQFARGTGSALGIRKDRIAVQGMSAGARLGAVAFTSPDDAYFAGPELWPGITDTVNAFIGFYHPYDGSMQYQEQYYGGPDTSSQLPVLQRWDEADALTHANRARGPALLLTGDRDWDLQITQQEQFKAALEAAGQWGRTVVVPGGGHGFDEGDGTRLSRLGEQAATEVLTFLNDAFPQDPPRPAQAEQPDLANAPTGTGVPQTTYAPRPRATTSNAGGARNGYGSGPASGGRGATTIPPTSTVSPSTTPPTSRPVTTVPPVTTSIPPVTNPPSSPVTTSPTVPSNPGGGHP